MFNFNGASLVPDFSQSLSHVSRIVDNHKKNKNSKKFNELAGSIFGGSDGGIFSGAEGEGEAASDRFDPQKLNELFQRNPEAAKFLMKAHQSNRKDILDGVASKNADENRFAQIASSLDPDEQIAMIADRAQQIQKLGGNPQELIDLANMSHDERQARFKNIIAESSNFDQLLKAGQIGKPKDTRTSQQKDFELARSQGFNGTFLDYQKELKRAGRTSVNNKITNNNDRSELTRSQKTANQKKIISAQRDLVSLNKIKGRMSPDLFNSIKRAKDSISSSLEKVGFERSEESKQFNRELQGVLTPVKQYFNRYRKEITGAAAAITELEQLKRSTINGDLSYTQFSNRLDEIIAIAEADISVSQDALRDGVDLSTPKQSGSTDDPLGIL